jgi:hypothetical protein
MARCGRLVMKDGYGTNCADGEEGRCSSSGGLFACGAFAGELVVMRRSVVLA